MAQAQVTVKMEPAELAVIQEALKVYLMGLKGDDSGTRFRRFTAQGVLTAIGMGLPESSSNGHRQLSFVAEATEDEEESELQADEEVVGETESELEPVAA